MAVPRESGTLDPVTARLLERHKETFEEARREFGDHPEKSVAKFFRETFDPDLLNEISPELIDGTFDRLDDATLDWPERKE